jgi:hypothetical protein
MANKSEIILFPPQYFLLHQIAPFLAPSTSPFPLEPAELSRQRGALKEFVLHGGGDVPWGQKCISPEVLMKTDVGGWGGGRVVLGLGKPGLELRDSGRKGEDREVVFVEFKKEGPRRVEVARREDVFREERESREREKL